MITDQEIKDRIDQLVTAIEEEYLTQHVELKVDNDQNDFSENGKRRKLN